MRKVFTNQGDFNAMNAALDWCSMYGLSVGSAERGRPRGILFGNYEIAKWHNLRQADKDALHGTMTGDMRNGPVTVDLDEHAVRRAGGALPNDVAA